MADIPEYFKNAALGAGTNSGFNSSQFLGGLTGLFGGLFGDSGEPFEDAMDQFQKWGKKGEDVQNPFYNAGLQGMGNYQDWLGGMKDPTTFMNKIMGQYQASPYSKYLQAQSARSAQNAASAGGLMGSTPLMQQIQQNSQNISSGDMSNWLQNVLGINTAYGQGQQNLMTAGQNAANSLTDLYGNLGQQMGAMAYSQGAGDNQDLMSTIGGIASIAGSFL